MTLWLPPTAAEQPDVTLKDWAAYEVFLPDLGEPTVHVAGINVHGGEGRVTSPVVGVDGDARAVTTSTGRRYRLVGPPGLKGDAKYVWERWLVTWDAQVRGDAAPALLRQFGDPGVSEGQG